MSYEGLVFRTTDALRWGTGKGTPLDSLEGDENMWELISRLKDLEDNPPEAVSISNILVVGTQLSFQMSDGSSFGPFTLPIATFQLRGEYVPGTPYNELDVVSVAGQGLFLVRIDHVGEDPFDPAATDGDGNALYLPLYGDDSGYIYDVGFFYPGQPGLGIAAGAAIAGHVFIRPVRFDIGLPGSKATLETPAASALSFPVQKNGTVIGSVDFASGALNGTFTFDAVVSFAINDKVKLMRPASLDSAAQELSVTFLGVRI